jgi:hypothetical protein
MFVPIVGNSQGIPSRNLYTISNPLAQGSYGDKQKNSGGKRSIGRSLGRTHVAVADLIGPSQTELRLVRSVTPMQDDRGLV